MGKGDYSMSENQEMMDQPVKKNGKNNGIPVAIILVIGAIICVLIMTRGIVDVKSSKTTLIVTGSAKQTITSDLIVWTGSFSTQSPDLQVAYRELESSRAKVERYLKEHEVNEDQVVFSAIDTSETYMISEYGNMTNTVDYYTLSQTITISSTEIDKVTEISRRSTDLLSQGVSFDSYSPQYFYTKLAELKVEMLAQATKDAKKRAEMIAENAGNKLGGLKYADMGVMQITPLYSNEISDYGINDTSSLDKEITAVVHCNFEIK